MCDELSLNARQQAYFQALDTLRHDRGFVFRHEQDQELLKILSRSDALRAADSLVGQGAIHRVGFFGPTVGDDKLAAMAALERVNALWCESDQWAEAIGRLRKPKELRSLLVKNVSIGEEASCLETCSGLVDLMLWDCELGPTVLASVRGRSDLQRLKLTGSTLSKQVRLELCYFPRLKELVLDRTNVIDADIAEGELSASVEEVVLSGTAIGDATVERLAGLQRLSRLMLADTKVTERALEYLAKMPALKEIDLARTGISDEQLSAFLKEHPSITHYDVKELVTGC